MKEKVTLSEKRYVTKDKIMDIVFIFHLPYNLEHLYNLWIRSLPGLPYNPEIRSLLAYNLENL
jgi:hypothetical protein